MKIIFDEKTKLSTLSAKILAFPEIVQEAKKQINEELPPSEFDFFSLTVAEFLKLQHNETPHAIRCIVTKKNTTFVKYIKAVNSLDNGVERLTKIMQDTTIQQTADEKEALNASVPLTPEESILLFLKDAFRLQNLTDAQNMSLYEFIAARKAAYNDAMFQKRINLITASKKT